MLYDYFLVYGHPGLNEYYKVPAHSLKVNVVSDVFYEIELQLNMISYQSVLSKIDALMDKYNQVGKQINYDKDKILYQILIQTKVFKKEVLRIDIPYQNIIPLINSPKYYINNIGEPWIEENKYVFGKISFLTNQDIKKELTKNKKSEVKDRDILNPIFIKFNYQDNINTVIAAHGIILNKNMMHLRIDYSKNINDLLEFLNYRKHNNNGENIEIQIFYDEYSMDKLTTNKTGFTFYNIDDNLYLSFEVDKPKLDLRW